jgi:formiminotetrahydrofolate cyclodeaminase
VTKADLALALLNEQFSGILASIGRRDPDIPGSTASVLSALLGLAMGRMAIIITGDEKNDLAKACRSLDEISKQLSATADRDRHYFRQYIDALHERQAGDEAGGDHLKEAKIEATQEPLAAAQLIVESLELFRDIAGSIDRKVVSDLHSGANILSAAFSGTMMAAEINLHRQAEMRRSTAADRADLYDRRAAALAQLETMGNDAGMRY